ncbi:hypothetical protein [Pelomonas cellulosilytica]|uniref:Histidine phosphatase family protein n=1 Tax=Pelomonas cellulosilytica TaxID=2906762 RepID=A0ABS8XPZ6_9BURK|nr:hypothetical protein [Pelomonas sp. P8]MCE4553898.1 hypothetical protein [Pelomonas sp. P8]
MEISRTATLMVLFTWSIGLAVSLPVRADPAADPAPLKVVIVRHGEKPPDGDNLSCEGLNRALALPGVLDAQFPPPPPPIPLLAYVPSLKLGKETAHARMFQTVTPYAVKHGITVNSQFAEDDVKSAARDVLKRSGLVVMVWEHSQIPPLAKALGVSSPPPWHKHDFDSIWIITPAGGKADFATSVEGLTPASTCPP